jgi:hypothetical protein
MKQSMAIFYGMKKLVCGVAAVGGMSDADHA